MAKLKTLGPGESMVIPVRSGTWERPSPFNIILPSEWVKKYTHAKDRRVVITWKDTCLELSPVELPK